MTKIWEQKKPREILRTRAAPVQELWAAVADLLSAYCLSYAIEVCSVFT